MKENKKTIRPAKLSIICGVLLLVIHLFAPFLGGIVMPLLYLIIVIVFGSILFLESDVRFYTQELKRLNIIAIKFDVMSNDYRKLLKSIGRDEKAITDKINEIDNKLGVTKEWYS